MAWEQPEIKGPNIYPVQWDNGDAAFTNLYENAKNNTWNPAKLDWDNFHTDELTYLEKLGVAYFGILGKMFEYGAAPQFLLALPHLYEAHEQHMVITACLVTGRDEFIHEEFFHRLGDHMIPGFPHSLNSENEFEANIIDNVRWIEWKQSRTWKAYRDKMNAVYSQPWLGQAAILAPELFGMPFFHAARKNAPFKLVREGFKFVDLDEARHVAYGRMLLEKYVERFGLTDDQKEILPKVSVDGIIYAGASLFMPELIEAQGEDSFWLKPGNLVPPKFYEIHKTLVQEGRRILIGKTFEEAFNDARQGVLKVKTILESVGCKFMDVPLFEISHNDRGIEEEYTKQATSKVQDIA